MKADVNTVRERRAVLTGCPNVPVLVKTSLHFKNSALLLIPGSTHKFILNPVLRG